VLAFFFNFLVTWTSAKVASRTIKDQRVQNALLHMKEILRPDFMLIAMTMMMMMSCWLNKTSLKLKFVTNLWWW